MQFGSARKTARPSGGAVGRWKRSKQASLRPNDALSGTAMPSSLTLYKFPPAHALSLDDFEGLAVERLRALSKVEDAQARGGDIGEAVREAVRGTHLEARSREDLDADNASHWVLRLAFSATEELRRRFLNFELALFKFRFGQRRGMKEVQAFMDENGLGFSSMTQIERERHRVALERVYSAGNSWRGAQMKAFDRVTYFKVPFTEVLDLVSKRAVFLHQGVAYVPETDLVSILASRFRAAMSQKLAVAYKSLPYVCQEERIRPILKKLENAYLGPSYGVGSGSDTQGCSISVDNIDDVAPRSFPLCMRNCHAHIKRDHHLKHFGRLQFQLFLKGIGLTLQDCLKFFAREFTKKPISHDEFNKRYSYNIRHAYGQEGKRTNYTPRNCVQIIKGQQPSGPGEVHGCPFRSSSEHALRAQLVRQLGTTANDQIEQILAKVREKQPQLACRMHFEFAHPGVVPREAGNHPNAWFQESMEYYENHQPSSSAPAQQQSSAPAPTSTAATSAASNNEEQKASTPDAQATEAAPLAQQ